MTVVAPQIRHVMFDADDVLQYLPGGWYFAMEPYLGNRSREFFAETWAEERPTGLAAERWEIGDGHAALRDLLAAHGL